jgi:type VI secretion system protein ImpJ
MSSNNKVIWSQGLFVRPQHLQQHDRYIEGFVEGRCSTLHTFPWGFQELHLDHQLLTIGKVGIRSARGVFPDGTPFDIPNDVNPPEPLEVSTDVRDVVIHLALPVRRPGSLEITGEERNLARYVPHEYDALDTTLRGAVATPLQVGRLNTRLLLHSDRREDFACVGVAHVVEARTDRNVVLDESFTPPALSCEAAPRLAGFLNELEGLLHHRGVALAGRVSGVGRGAAEIADFLLLQAVNRYEPLVAHLARLPGLHPEDLYRILVGIAGELTTFTTAGKRPPAFPEYRHDALRETYAPVLTSLRESLSMVLEQTAVPIPLVEKKYGIRVAAITDRSLLATAGFVLAVKADIPTEEIRRRFGRQAKIGPVEQIRDMVNSQLPGIGLTPLPVAPRQIPYHAGCVYFELERSGEHWAQLKNSGGFALHVGAEFPGLELEFWAIRGPS